MMPEGYDIKPIKIARSRKIQVKQFEPEEVYIEYELQVYDESRINEAVSEATKMATAYLDEEERRLRNGDTLSNNLVSVKKPKNSVSTPKNGNFSYSLKITPEGNKLGDFRINSSKNGQYANFIHLWFKQNGDEFYVGHLRKDTGKFFFKTDNDELIKKYNIIKEQHFSILKL